MRHVNPQPRSYVACAMGLLGFQAEGSLEAELRASITSRDPKNKTAGCAWLRHTLMAFRRADGGAPASPLLPLPEVPTPEFAEAYLNLTAARCPTFRAAKRGKRRAAHKRAD